MERSSGRLTVERVDSTRRWVCRMVMRLGSSVVKNEAWRARILTTVGLLASLMSWPWGLRRKRVLYSKLMVDSHELESDDCRIWSFIVVMPLERQDFSQQDLVNKRLILNGSGTLLDVWLAQR